ncbi:hypothetical protein BDW66DRAFT_152507 [Aspergillus desertorum]
MSSKGKASHIPAKDVIAAPVDVDSIADAMKRIISFASSSEAHTTTVIANEIDRLRGQVKEKEDELAKLRKMISQHEEHKTIAVNEMFTAMEKEKVEVRRLGAEIGSLKESITEKDKDLAEKSQQIKTLEGEVHTLQSARSQEAAKVAKAAQKISSLQAELEEKKKTIDKLKAAESSAKALLAGEKTKNAEADAFSDLWDYATAQMSAILAQDIHTAVLKDKLRWERFRKASETALPHHIPLLASNTPAAKGMRLAIILGILSREIDRCIFQPNYLFSEEAQLRDIQLRDILSQLAMTDGAKESFCRAVLLSIGQNTQEDSLHSRVQSVVRKVSFYLCDLLSEAQYAEFRQNIENVVNRAVSVWLPIQRAEKRYEPDFDPLSWDDGEWRPFKFPGQETSLSSPENEIPSNNLLTIFPRISLVYDHCRHPLTFVIQLRKSHKLYIDAEREITSPTAGRRLLFTGTRRRAFAADASRPHANNNAFLEGASTAA